MNPSDFLPTEDTQLEAWLENFATTCEKYETELDLNVESFALINGAVAGFAAGMTGIENARAISKAATVTKNEAKATATTVARTFAREFKANPSIPASILSELQIVTNSPVAPVTSVSNVDVIGCDDGVNKVTWNRNGNSSTTSFIVEYKFPNNPLWILAGVVTKTKFDHKDQVPGDTVFYRVTATRNGVNAVPSVPVAAYPTTGDTTLTIAA